MSEFGRLAKGTADLAENVNTLTDRLLACEDRLDRLESREPDDPVQCEGCGEPMTDVSTTYLCDGCGRVEPRDALRAALEAAECRAEAAEKEFTEFGASIAEALGLDIQTGEATLVSVTRETMANVEGLSKKRDALRAALVEARAEIPYAKPEETRIGIIIDAALGKETP